MEMCLSPTSSKVSSAAFPLLNFPNELILMIASSLATSDIASLVRTQKYIHALLTPMLYTRGSRKRDVRGQTPLHWAVEASQYASAVHLLLRGADLKAQSSKNEETPLHVAVKCGRLEFVKLFLNTDSSIVDFKDSDGLTALHSAVCRGKDDIMNTILMKAPDSIHTKSSYVEMTALHYAAVAGRILPVAILTGLGSDINARDMRGATPLHLAAGCGHYQIVQRFTENAAILGIDIDTEITYTRDTPLHRAAISGSESVVNLLLSSGASPLRRNRVGETPLHGALCRGHESIVKILLESDQTGQLPYVLCASGQSLLTFAFCGAKAPSISLIKLLMQYDLDVNHRSDINGRTPLHCAAIANDSSILELFLRSGGDVDLKDVSGNSLLHGAVCFGTSSAVQVLVEWGAILDEYDMNGQTPLYCAVDRGRESIARYLLDAGANINIPDTYGMAPLSRACAQCPIHVSLSMVSMLVRRGADVRSRDEDGMTALHHACREGHLSVVRFLVEHGGADVMDEDIKGNTALDLAEKHGRIEVAEFLFFTFMSAF